MASFGRRVASWFRDQIRRIFSVREVRLRSCLYSTEFGYFWVPNSPWADTISRRICASRIFDEEVLDKVLQEWVPGTKFIDVGANLGQMSIIAGHRMLELTAQSEEGPQTPLIHAFEAQPFVRDLLLENVEKNKLSSLIRVHGEPVWSSSGVLMHFPDPRFASFANWGSNSISLGGSHGAMASLTVDDCNIDGQVSVMKIDVQGADLEAMVGAQTLIETHRPALIFEYEDKLTRSFGRNFSDYWDFLTRLEYKIVWGKSDNFLAKHFPE